MHPVGRQFRTSVAVKLNMYLSVHCHAGRRWRVLCSDVKLLTGLVFFLYATSSVHLSSCPFVCLVSLLPFIIPVVMKYSSSPALMRCPVNLYRHFLNCVIACLSPSACFWTSLFCFFESLPCLWCL